MNSFEAYPKMPRMKSAEMTITEKIDGTNAQILIVDGGIELVGSRKRQILPDIPKIVDDEGVTIEKKQTLDNYGFAQWVLDNMTGLVEFLGDGRHYGEWAGPGIQKNPLGLEQKLFFLFNTHRNPPEKFESLGHLVPQLRAVPILFQGKFSLEMISTVADSIYLGMTEVPDAQDGNEGEGIVISAFGQKFKRTADDRPKSIRKEK